MPVARTHIFCYCSLFVWIIVGGILMLLTCEPSHAQGSKTVSLSPQPEYRDTLFFRRFTPLKRIRLVMHVFRDDSGKGNPTRPPHETYDLVSERHHIQNMILNSKVEHLKAWGVRGLNYYYHSNGDSFHYDSKNQKMIYERDSRILFRCDTILFHNCSYYFKNIKQYQAQYAEEFYEKFITRTRRTQPHDTCIQMPALNDSLLNGALHVFVAYGNGYSGQGQASGLADKKWLMLAVFGDFTCGVFAHELGHNLGLDHVIARSKSHCFNPPPKVYGTTDNIMDYYRPPLGRQIEFDTCQIKYMHQMIQNNVGDLADIWIKDYCSYHPDEKIIIRSGERIVWNDVKFLWGDLIVEKGGHLTIKNTVSFPAKAKLIINEGASVVVDGGILTNVCGQKWAGIKGKERLIILNGGRTEKTQE